MILPLASYYYKLGFLTNVLFVEYFFAYCRRMIIYFVKNAAFWEYFGNFFGHIIFQTCNNTQLSMLIEKKS